MTSMTSGASWTMRVLGILLAVISASCDGEEEEYPLECWFDVEWVVIPTLDRCGQVGDPGYCSGECSTDAVDAVCVTRTKLNEYSRCAGACLDRDEASCLAAEGCRATYHRDAYASCWPAHAAEPVHVGACERLDLDECVAHDNCSAHYKAGLYGKQTFERCSEEIAPLP